MAGGCDSEAQSSTNSVTVIIDECLTLASSKLNGTKQYQQRQLHTAF
jgi:hypothetical protein